MIDLQYAQEEFQKYLDQYDRNDEKIKLKIIHTEGVIDCVRKITLRMDISVEDKELAELIALLHDIGRFEQIRCFDSFEPGTMDHAAYGVGLLFGPKNMIRQFVKNTQWDSIIKTAIAKHSDFQLEGIADEQTLFHAKMIRDADKLDNCRVKLEESVEVLVGTTAENAGTYEISDKVWEACLHNCSVRSADRITPIDYWVSYLAYFFDVNFAETFQIIEEENYVERIIQQIPYSNPDTKEKMNILCERLQTFIGSRASCD